MKIFKVIFSKRLGGHNQLLTLSIVVDFEAERSGEAWTKEGGYQSVSERCDTEPSGR